MYQAGIIKAITLQLIIKIWPGLYFHIKVYTLYVIAISSFCLVKIMDTLFGLTGKKILHYFHLFIQNMYDPRTGVADLDVLYVWLRFLYFVQLHFWGCLHFWSCLHLWDHLHFLVIFFFDAIFVFEVIFIFKVVFSFEVIFIFEVLFIF